MKTSHASKFFFISLAFALMLTGLYVFQINSLTARAYAIGVSEKKLAQLQETNKNLQTNLTESFSVQNISQLALQLHYEKVDTVSYIQVLAGSVAKRPAINE